MPEGLTVHRLVPLFKDWNEVLQHRAEITDGKYIREAIYGLKEPTQEETVEIIRMSEVDTQTVEWLWEPYIPFGKVTIVQGNPGEGKTTFALRLAAACTTGGTLPGMKPLPPFQVIYQTAEDGLGDTVKPRLMEAEADLDRVLVIDEAKRELTLSDERIEKAITQNGARLIILDPIQAYMGEKTDMNRANEVRPMFRRLADVAERTGCAVILIGHLNKAAGGQSAYRGFAIAAEQREQENYMRTAELSTEQNYNMIDGQINNTPSVDELEEKAKRGEVISLSALAAAVKAEDGRTPQRDPDGKKPSIRAQLKADRAQSCKPQQREKEQEAKRSIRQALEME